MQHDDNRWLEKVRGLLAMAEDPALDPAAAENYAAKAMELMAKYGIEEAMLAAAAPERQVVADRMIDLQNPYLEGKAHLLYVIAWHFGCRSVTLYGTRNGRRTKSTHLFGFEGDIQRVDILYTSLLLQLHTGLVNAVKPFGENLRSFRLSWIAGFNSKVGQRLAEATARAKVQAETEAFATAGTSVALVLADRSHAVDRRYDEVYPDTRKTRPRDVRSTAGWHAGTNAGTHADLGGTRINTRAPHAIANRPLPRSTIARTARLEAVRETPYGSKAWNIHK